MLFEKDKTKVTQSTLLPGVIDFTPIHIVSPNGHWIRLQWCLPFFGKHTLFPEIGDNRNECKHFNRRQFVAILEIKF